MVEPPEIETDCPVVLAPGALVEPARLEDTPAPVTLNDPETDTEPLFDWLCTLWLERAVDTRGVEDNKGVEDTKGVEAWLVDWAPDDAALVPEDGNAVVEIELLL